MVVCTQKKMIVLVEVGSSERLDFYNVGKHLNFESERNWHLIFDMPRIRLSSIEWTYKKKKTG
jgi:hypothetical protein